MDWQIIHISKLGVNKQTRKGNISPLTRRNSCENDTSTNKTTWIGPSGSSQKYKPYCLKSSSCLFYGNVWWDKPRTISNAEGLVKKDKYIQTCTYVYRISNYCMYVWQMQMEPQHLTTLNQPRYEQCMEKEPCVPIISSLYINAPTLQYPRFVWFVIPSIVVSRLKSQRDQTS